MNNFKNIIWLSGSNEISKENTDLFIILFCKSSLHKLWFGFVHGECLMSPINLIGSRCVPDKQYGLLEYNFT